MTPTEKRTGNPAGSAEPECMICGNFVAVTIDYETWQPIPEGKSIDWEADVFRPARVLMETFERCGAPITFFVEMGEYFWLERNRPELAAKMARQLQDAVRRGHDVQLHLHPNWLPELGARCEDGEWHWDWALRTAHDYPGDLTALIGRCKDKIESITRSVRPDHEVTCFRAGGYSAQPFHRLHDALAGNGISFDSSVYAGGKDAERGYDYSSAYSEHQPYFADPTDPQLKAHPSETAVIELPIFAPEPGHRWCLDGNGARLLTASLFEYRKLRFFRATPKLIKGLARPVVAWMRRSGRIARCLPGALQHHLGHRMPEKKIPAQCFVMIGHTKSDLDPISIGDVLECLKGAGYQMVGLSTMARIARKSLRLLSEFQAASVETGLAGDSAGGAQSNDLLSRIPLDRARVLDFGCGAGHSSVQIAGMYPWMRVTGIDGDPGSIAAARQRYGMERVLFQAEDFVKLSLPDSAFDCVVTNSGPDAGLAARLAEAYRVLANGGVLLATASRGMKELLTFVRRAGFVNIRRVRASSWSLKTCYAAWKRTSPVSELERAMEAMNWVHNIIDPSFGSELGVDASKIVAFGVGSCLDYCIVLGRLLEREGFKVVWVTMIADGHRFGRGPGGRESHEVVEVHADGCRVVLDPMTNICHRHSLLDLLRNPELANVNSGRDERYTSRHYHLYDTAEWYSRVVLYKLRCDIATPAFLVRGRKNPYLRKRPVGDRGRLVLGPGDRGGGE